ncbi:MAG: hypothetical protein AAFR74_03790, partial [Pseudomonadota bacterium]
MTTYSRSRKKMVFRLAIAAAILWALLAATSLFSAPQTDNHAEMGQPVLSGFAERRLETSQIKFTMADERYTLARTETGWVMDEEDGFPVRQDRLATLAAGLET